MDVTDNALIHADIAAAMSLHDPGQRLFLPANAESYSGNAFVLLRTTAILEDERWL
jgi:hypothetical protein